MNHILSNRYLKVLLGTLFMGAFLFLAPQLPAAETKSPTEAHYYLQVTRCGGFLNDATKEPRELLRRLAKKLEAMPDFFTKDQYEMGGFSSDPATASVPIGRPIPATVWTPEHRASADALLKKAEPLLRGLQSQIPLPTSGFHARLVIDPKTLAPIFKKMAEDPKLAEKLRPRQMDNLQNKLLPLLEASDLVGLFASITSEGLKLQIEALGGQGFAEIFGPIASGPVELSCLKYLDEEALLGFAQIHDFPAPATVMNALKAVPQLMIIQDYLTKAGLDLEKDLLPLRFADSLVSVNLTPSGDGGLFDLRGIVRVSEPSRILPLLPGLKQLAMNLGIFISPTLEAPVSVKVSYFLAPSLGLHFSMMENLLLVATSRDNLSKLATRIQEANSGKQFQVNIPEGTHRYWRVRFQNINNQLQKFLQSPLLASRGVPPVPNLSALEELSDLTMLTRILKDRLVISLDLPFRK